MPSLTRAEAAARAELLRVHAYAVDLDVTDPVRYRSATVIAFSCSAPGASTFVELKGARLERAVLNGRELDPAELDDNRLPLRDLATDNRLEVHATAPYSRGGDGLHRFVDPEDGEVYLYGHAPLDDAQRMFACFDQPDLKAPITLSVTAPERWTVRGNAPLRGRDGGRWEFAATPPLAPYLFSLLAGPWHVLDGEHDGIPLALLCRRSLAAQLDADADELFAATAAGFDRYHEMFGVRYAFTKYDQAFVPEFAGGAVENPALVCYREEFLFRTTATDYERHRRFVVMLHELAHMWFGDLVTLRWWDDIWLNEAFAEYMGWRVAAETGRYPDALAGFAIWRERWGYLADQRPSTHPVAPADVADTAHAMLNFDGISYAKGAAVLRQLAALLGDDVFLAGLREFFSRYRFGNASLADLLAVLAEVSGADLDDWSGRWLRSAGVNTLRPVVTRDAGGRVTALVVEQSGEPVRPHRMAVAAYTASGSVRRVAVTVDAAAFPVEGFAGMPGDAVVLLNDGDDTYAKVRLDDAGRAALPAVLAGLADPMARALLWAAAMDAVRDGLLPPAEFLALLNAGLPAERETSVFVEVLGFARDGLARRGLAPMETLAGLCASALAAAEPGSGRQLALASALVGVAGPADAETLAGWLTAGQTTTLANAKPPAGAPADGQTTTLVNAMSPEGLVVTAELRWAALAKLAALDVAGEAEIAAEAERDPSAAGAQRAATCRAARPDPAAKAQAWERIVGDESPRIAIAAAAGFWQPGQEALTGPYVDRYFAEAPGMLAGKHPLAALAVLRQAFPQYDPRALALADELLARDGVDPTLRREIGDAADEVRRWSRLS